jgi:hypothetical protein
VPLALLVTWLATIVGLGAAIASTAALGAGLIVVLLRGRD